MQREIIRPTLNQPVFVKLDFGAEGIERPSKFGGAEYQYTVNDDAQIIYLPKVSRDALIRTGAQAGDTVRLIKQKRGSNVYFDVSVVPDAYDQGYGHDEGDGHDEGSEPAPISVLPNGQARTNGKALPPVKEYFPERHATPQPAPAQVFPMEEIANGLFEVAARIVLRAEKHCKSIGLPVEANFDDVRSLAISFLIERSRNGSR